MCIGNDFYDYKEYLAPIRAIDNIGKVDEYKLILSLNELWRMFLTVENFISQKQHYVEQG